jgi:hypothetical protein
MKRGVRVNRIFGQEKPALDSLVHAGVKGMKWGHRKAKPTTEEIHSARYRQMARETQMIRYAREAAVTTGAARKTAERNAEKHAIDLQTNEDRVTAARMTSGEKAVHAILLGPIALVTIPANKLHVNYTARTVDELRKQVK